MGYILEKILDKAIEMYKSKDDNLYEVYTKSIILACEQFEKEIKINVADKSTINESIRKIFIENSDYYKKNKNEHKHIFLDTLTKNNLIEFIRKKESNIDFNYYDKEQWLNNFYETFLSVFAELIEKSPNANRDEHNRKTEVILENSIEINDKLGDVKDIHEIAYNIDERSKKTSEVINDIDIRVKDVQVIAKGIDETGKDTNNKVLEMCNRLENMYNSTSNKTISSDTKNEQEIKYILINSFLEKVKSEKNYDKFINFKSLFNGRYIKEEKLWREYIYTEIKSMISELSSEYEYCIDGRMHQTIMFMLGRHLNSTSGINTCIMQSTVGNEVWRFKNDDTKQYKKLEFENIKINDDFEDVAVIVEINNGMLEDVKAFIEKNNIPIGRILYCHANVANNQFVKNGKHSVELSETVKEYIKKRTSKEKRAHLHLFMSVPNAMVFNLGQLSKQFGQFTIYEFDIEEKCDYYKTATFSPKDIF